MSAGSHIHGIIDPPIFKVGEYAKKDWKTSDDSVYSRLAYHVSNDADKEIIQDFMNMYYYLMIRYSKACFKKHEDWQKQKFNYSLANELDCHQKLLSIQRQMSAFRKQFKTAMQTPAFYTPNKIMELLNFIKTEIKTLANTIYQPVSYISQHIMVLIEKHKCEPARMHSSKVNYEVFNVLAKIEADHRPKTPIQSFDHLPSHNPGIQMIPRMEAPKMIMVSFKGGNARF